MGFLDQKGSIAREFRDIVKLSEARSRQQLVVTFGLWPLRRSSINV
eukprot:CAMPEP_0206508112 /NCGR_PEP_ID=MMETSP0324_2-20121206/58090_1 /ASSEMBLY_ACC=CAM_ASM_000836 /TAXON_ID=2866 /ORGANISM="Crypthecodinium cohnii, Strain Seligo" /LENGTH=45 /DNA_ID= /DNA_START= /DNA_END= /DNA_ORIENTATION=